MKTFLHESPLLGVLGQTLVIICLLGVPVQAGADMKEAGRLFSVGQAAAQRADYLAAIAAFEASFRAHPHPNTLYAMARAHHNRFLEDGDVARARRALGLYQRFARELPRSPWRARADGHIKALQAALVAQTPARPQPATQPASRPAAGTPDPQEGPGEAAFTRPVVAESRPTTPSRSGADDATTPASSDRQSPPAAGSRNLSRWLRWTAFGLGLVMTGVGAGLCVSAHDVNEDFRQACSSCTNAASVDELKDEGQQLEQAGWSLIGVGAATVATAVVLLLVLPPGDGAVRVEKRARRYLSPVVGEAAVGLSFTSEF